jgi:hypothetical protein
MMTKGSKSGRNAEGDFLFPVPSLSGSGDFRKMHYWRRKNFFWMDSLRYLSNNFPKKSFSGTNNAKILQKSPPPETCQEQEKEIMEIIMFLGIRIVGKILSEEYGNSNCR